MTVKKNTLYMRCEESVNANTVVHNQKNYNLTYEKSYVNQPSFVII